MSEELHALYERGADARLPSISLTLPVYVDRVARRRAAAHEQRRREENFWSKADAPPGEGGMPPRKYNRGGGEGVNVIYKSYDVSACYTVYRLTAPAQTDSQANGQDCNMASAGSLVLRPNGCSVRCSRCQ